MNEFLTPKQAAEFLGISDDLLSRLVDAGVCPQPTDLLDRVAYSRRGLINWLERGAPVADLFAYEIYLTAESEQDRANSADLMQRIQQKLQERK